MALAAPAPADAQKKGSKKNTARAAKVEEERPTAQMLIDEYRFDEAIEMLEEDIAKAKKRKKPTEQMEMQLTFAREGASLLLGTEQVVFIDSLVLDAENFLKAIRLGTETGSLHPLKALLEKTGLKTATDGEIAFMNELKDKLVFSAPDKDGQLKLHTSSRIGNQWEKPVPLSGIATREENQDYPFVLADGVTIYYAAAGAESFGGYDIFVSRYNAGDERFVKPENIGMPFNSPANDYLYVVDEQNKIGWFVSDRNQEPGKVCLYTFIPNETREVYSITDENAKQVRHAARLHSIAETQTNPEAVAAARKRLATINTQEQALQTNSMRYVINDNTVYYDLNQFQSEPARRIANQLTKNLQLLKEKEKQLDALRRAYSQSEKNGQNAAAILKLEKEVEELLATVHTMEKNMRQAEMK